MPKNPWEWLWEGEAQLQSQPALLSWNFLKFPGIEALICSPAPRALPDLLLPLFLILFLGLEPVCVCLPEFPLLPKALFGAVTVPAQPCWGCFCCVAVTSFLSSGPLFLRGGLTRFFGFFFIQPICTNHQAADALAEAAATNGGERLLEIIWC